MHQIRHTPASRLSINEFLFWRVWYCFALLCWWWHPLGFCIFFLGGHGKRLGGEIGGACIYLYLLVFDGQTDGQTGEEGNLLRPLIKRILIPFTLLHFRLIYITPSEAPTLPSINPLTPLSPISGSTLTSTSSRTWYARCRFRYPSPQTSSSVPTSATISSTLPKARRATRGGTSDAMAEAVVCLMVRISAGVGGGGEGGGRALLGKRFRRACWSKGATRVAGRTWVVRRWWTNLVSTDCGQPCSWAIGLESVNNAARTDWGKWEEPGWRAWRLAGWHDMRVMDYQAEKA